MKPFNWDNFQYKDFIIYSFQWKNKKPMIQYAIEQNKFKQEFINKYCSLSLDYIRENYTINPKNISDEIKLREYKKPHLTLAEEIGMDMIQEKHDIITGTRWDNWYMAIPKTNPDMIEYVENIKPDFVKIIKWLK